MLNINTKKIILKQIHIYRKLNRVMTRTFESGYGIWSFNTTFNNIWENDSNSIKILWNDMWKVWVKLTLTSNTGTNVHSILLTFNFKSTRQKIFHDHQEKYTMLQCCFFSLAIFIKKTFAQIIIKFLQYNLMTFTDHPTPC